MPSDDGRADSYWERPKPLSQVLTALESTAPTMPPVAPVDEPDAATDPEEYDEQAPSRPRRVLKVLLIVLVLGVCAAVPWVAPQVPDWFGSKVPRTTNVPVETHDPTLAPPTHSKGGEVIPAAGLTGFRLQSAGKPLEVVVKRLKVHSDVIPISGQSGELLPPSNPQVLGWWQEGRVAGAPEGGVVVTGHTVHTGGGAFDHLGELTPGDKVRVRTAAGWIGYVVVSSDTYTTKQLAKKATDIFQRSGDGHLVLITCSNYNGTIYLTNSVVYAVPVSDAPFGPNSPGTS